MPLYRTGWCSSFAWIMSLIVAQHASLLLRSSACWQMLLPTVLTKSGAHLGELPPIPGCAMNTLSRVHALRTRQPSAACKSHTTGMPAAPHHKPNPTRQSPRQIQYSFVT